MSGFGRTTGRIAVIVVVALSGAALGAIAVDTVGDRDLGPPLGFKEQLCALPQPWLDLTQRGYFPGRSGQVAILPRTPMYMTTGGKGWTHSGPWDYLQRVPLLFYGPGFVDDVAEIQEPIGVTLADVAPTVATLLGHPFPSSDGQVLGPVVARKPRRPVKLVVTVVWDGGGFNGLVRWRDAWPNLKRIMQGGTLYNARVGSSPSVTPAVHTTLGAGVFPSTHGITDVPMRNDAGIVVDSFFENSARFIQVPTLAEKWDEANDNRALVGMVGYEPWHLGMIGKGAEAAGGDRDHAVWLNRARNTWVTNRDYYDIPATFRDQSDLEERLSDIDGANGDRDDKWLGVPLDEVSRIEENPAFIAHHEEKLEEMIQQEGYGKDRITDLLFTNFKQIDRLAHYFNMESRQVRGVMSATDDALGNLVSFLDDQVGKGNYLVIMTADHGMQPDDEAIDGYAIDPNETERDIAAEFGPIVRSVWPTQVFLLDDEMEARGLTPDDVARFLSDYRLRDNATRVDQELFGAGPWEPRDRLFQLAVPSELLGETTC